MSAIQGRGVMKPLVKLLIFAAVTIVLTGLLAQTLGALGFGRDTEYKARFTDVTGLLAGDDVRIAGVKVGKVTEVKLVHNKTAEVAFGVDRDVPVPATAHLQIRYRNLVGQRYISLTEGAGSAARLPAGATIPISQTQPSLDLTVLFNGFRPLFTALTPEDVNKFAYEIIQVFQGEGGTVTDLLKRTASLTNALADRDAVIGRVIDNLNDVLATLNARDRQLSEVIKQLQSFVSGLAADRTAIGQSLENIADLADATAGLVRDARPALRADIAQLRTLATTLNANTSVIEGTLARLPVRTAALARTAAYGSWFNFFMCNFDGQVTVPGMGPVSPSTFNSSEARCQQSGTAAGKAPTKPKPSTGKTGGGR